MQQSRTNITSLQHLKDKLSILSSFNEIMNGSLPVQLPQ